MDIQNEKAQIAKELHEVLSSLHDYFPWVVVEIVLSLEGRLGKNSPFIKKITENVLNDLSQEVLEKYVPECLPDEAHTYDMTASLFGVFKEQLVQNLLDRPAFSLDIEESEECKPWDTAEKEALFSTQNLSQKEIAKINTIQSVKASLTQLKIQKNQLEQKPDDFHDEINAIEILDDVLDTSPV